ncbi:MAG: ATP synthase subunit C [Clostridia bacterium]|nr:ATP synthase subunit C [Clostridia bacterium]
MLMGIITVLWLLSVVVPFGMLYFSSERKKNGKRALAANIISYAVIMFVGAAVLFSGSAFAAPEAPTVMKDPLTYIAAALSTGLAAIGAGIAVASSASAAIGAMSENEGIMGKALIFVALAEGIALYGLLISFLILQ